MADREIRYLFRNKQTSGSTLPSDGTIGEPFVNAFEGRMFFYGVSGGTYGQIDGQTNVFEVGSNVDFINAKSGITTPYVDFQTGKTSNPDKKAGRTFYDDTENCLSFYPYTNDMDVTVNIGQENVIKVYNNSGVDILNGQVCYISGTYNGGIPEINLAIASGTSGEHITTGVATHNIPNGDYGFITNFGLIRDINITGVTEGCVLYLSDTVVGGFECNYSNLNVTSRVSKIGRVIKTGTTDGKILVTSIQNEFDESLTLKERDVFIGNVSSTGAFYFTGITKTSPTTFDVSSVKGWIIDNTNSNSLDPDVQFIQYGGATNITTPYLSSDTITYILVDSASTLVTQATSPTLQQRRQSIYLGKVVHTDKTSIEFAVSRPDIVHSPMSQVRDVWESINLVNGGVYPYYYTGLTISTTAGYLYGLGIGFVDDELSPSRIYYSGTTPTTFQYKLQTGGTFANTIDIDPLNYDNSGVLTSVPLPGKTSTNQRVFLTQNGSIRIQYGQTTYADLTTAIAAAQTESFTTFSNFVDNAVLIAIVSIRRDATDLADATQARILWASKFGETIGVAGGISVATLQSAYDNSSTPEIITNATLDGVQFRGGTGSDDAKNIIIENNAGSETGWIKADGSSSFLSLTASTISASTLYSGSTNLYDIFLTSADGNDITRVQQGLNTYTGGTDNYPTVNVSGLTIDNIYSSGNTIFCATTINGELVVFNAASANTLNIGNSPTNAALAVQSREDGIIATYRDIDGEDVFIFQGKLSDQSLQVGIGDFNATYAYPGYVIKTLTSMHQFINGNVYIGNNQSFFSTTDKLYVDGNTMITGEFSAGTIYSGSTNLYDIFLTSAPASDTTRIQQGLNTYTGGTDNYPTVNISAATLDNISVSGASSLGVVSATTIISGSTNLYDIFLTSAPASDTTRIQQGLNTYTGGTDNYPTVNVSAATLDNLSVSGASSLGVVSATTIYSGSTNLYDIFLTSAPASDITRIQQGLNTYTGGTDNYPTVNISATTLDNISVSGASSLGVVSATTIISGSTNLYDIFSTGGGGGTAIIFSSDTLISSAWTLSGTYYYQDLTINGVTTTNHVDVGAASSSYENVENYAYSRIICSAQTTNTLTFAAVYQPSSNLTVNIKIYDI